jgi:DNA-binding beta-propeller fold protein YncE
VLWEAPVGDDPRALAVAPNGDIWVASRGDATIHVLDAASGTQQDTIALPHGSEPEGIAFAPDGSAAYVTLDATGQLLRLDPAGAITGTLAVGPRPRGIAIAGDSSRLHVTRFVSDPARLTDPGNPATLVLPEGEVREVDLVSFSVVRTVTLHFDAGPDTEASGRGVPNYLGSIHVSPDGLRALVPSKKDNVARGVFLDGEPLTFESRVRTILSEIDLVANAENAAARIDFNDRDMAQSALFSPLGDLVFVGLQGTNLVEVRDANQPTLVLAAVTTGRAPQGLALDVDGLGRTLLYVHDFLSRSVSIFDASALVDGSGNGLPLVAEVEATAVETLSPEVLQGKRIFYHAFDNRMSRDGYLSCASCHQAGDGDGQIWDFTQAGEGLRNTIELTGRGGMAHGNVHWTANFDEIQDFENDIRLGFGGTGFLSEPDWLDTSDPLGAPKAGRSADLDALAAYVASLVRFPESPHRNADGSLTPDGVAGKALFESAGCASCHAGVAFRDGQRHDVGTIQASSGQGSGQPLAGVGIDTPTLKGLWKSAPYLHNGAAATLADVLANTAHAGTLASGDADLLVAYLLQIDDRENPACSNFLDDDGDTLIDLADPDCSDPLDDSESPPPPPACSDGIDNDDDGRVDHPNDPGCDSPADTSENAPGLVCDDGLDNDGDGLIDFRVGGLGDPGCGGPLWLLENPECDNGIDDDGDGKIDWDGAGVADPDPHCESMAHRDREKAGSACGLGVELALLLPLLAAWGCRRSRG